ncbi:MAG TPA: helix-hairpin-helix domain-containing protein [Armatimonadota bacterium]|nr:helix-hairpin-helix domain-containing protein [Armatimonadota bacterium]
MTERPVVIHASKPGGRIAKLLTEAGVEVLSAEGLDDTLELYLLSDRLIVQRRTGHGLVNGIADKSLFTSAIDMAEQFACGVLIVEGEVDYSFRGIDRRAVRGALSALVVQYGLSLLSTADEDETVAMLVMMAGHEQQGVPEVSLVPKRRAEDLPDLQRRVVEMLPKVGAVTARALLQRFGTIERLVAASEDELREARGIGEKSAAEIRQVLGAEYEAVDTEREIEDAVAGDPAILFGDEPVELLARQHVISGEGADRHIVDLVFVDMDTGEIVLVELKRGRLQPADAHQLLRYLAEAKQSKLLGPLIEGGARLRGVLASVEESAADVSGDDLQVRRVDPRAVIGWHKTQRETGN